MKRIGITETGDISFNLEAFDNLKEANIIITKRLTPKLIEKLIEYKEKIIFHLTVTGFGGTKLEEMVPTKEISRKNLDILIDKGFPIEQIVLRIDPIIPTIKGIKTALSVVELFKDSGIKRIRFSSMDMYKHVIERFEFEKIDLPYKTFHSKQINIDKLFEILKNKCDEYGILLEACAENVPDENKVGCISKRDVEILGLSNEIELIGNSEQRRGCLCPANKIELLKIKPKRCENKCLYCFWKD